MVDYLFVYLLIYLFNVYTPVFCTHIIFPILELKKNYLVNKSSQCLRMSAMQHILLGAFHSIAQSLKFKDMKAGHEGVLSF